MAGTDRTEIEIAILQSRADALEYLPALAVARLAKDERSLEAILGDVSGAGATGAAGEIAGSAFPPPHPEGEGAGRIHEYATAGVFAKFRRDVRRLLASFRCRISPI